MITEKYESTFEGKDLKCPYCGEFYSDSWEIDFNDDAIEIECDCGKKFYGSESIIRNYKAEADCELNKENHNFVDTLNGCEKCSICGRIEVKKLKQKING